MLYSKQVIAIVLFLSILSGCAVVPKFAHESALENCEVFTRRIELNHIGVGSKKWNESMETRESNNSHSLSGCDEVCA